jgi:hypothetical protein
VKFFVTTFLECKKWADNEMALTGNADENWQCHGMAANANGKSMVGLESSGRKESFFCLKIFPTPKSGLSPLPNLDQYRFFLQI